MKKIELTDKEVELVDNILNTTWIQTESMMMTYEKKNRKTKEYKYLCKHYDMLDCILTKLNQ